MSNHIEHIEITNFKSIRHAKIEGCKRINVFIGYPNVGKSAILEAISALAYLQKDFNKPFDTLCRLKGRTELFYNGNVKEEVSIRYRDDINVGFRYLSESTLDFQTEELEQNKEDKTANGTWYTLKNLRFVGDETDPVYLNQVKELIKVRKYSFQSSVYDIKTNALDFSFPHGENLVEIIQHNRELRKEVSELFKFYNLKLLIDQGTNSIRGLKEIDEETIYTIPFHQMADTLQRLIFHKAAIMSNENTVLLFEEPEAHMFPPYIRMFTKDIIFDKGRNNQYFIATHSPVVLSDFLEDAREELAIHLVGYKDGATTIKTLNNSEVNEVHEYGEDLFFNIESYLD